MRSPQRTLISAMTTGRPSSRGYCPRRGRGPLPAWFDRTPHGRFESRPMGTLGQPHTRRVRSLRLVGDHLARSVPLPRTPPEASDGPANDHLVGGQPHPTRATTPDLEERAVNTSTIWASTEHLDLGRAWLHEHAPEAVAALPSATGPATSGAAGPDSGTGAGWGGYGLTDWRTKELLDEHYPGGLSAFLTSLE